jgi:hypothetical protein
MVICKVKWLIGLPVLEIHIRAPSFFSYKNQTTAQPQLPYDPLVAFLKAVSRLSQPKQRGTTSFINYPKYIAVTVTNG